MTRLLRENEIATFVNKWMLALTRKFAKASIKLEDRQA